MVISNVFSSLSTVVNRTHSVVDHCVSSAAAVVLEFGILSFIITSI